MAYREFSKKIETYELSQHQKELKEARSTNLAKVARSLSVDHRSLFQLMRMT